MIYLYNQGGSKNHGCEAIVRSTKKIIDKQMTLMTLQFDEDIKYELDKILDIIDDKEKSFNGKTFKYYIAALETKLNGSFVINTLFRKKTLFNRIKKNDIAFSIGGDTYCYPGYEMLSNINYILKKKKVKTVLWGCSIEPSLLKDKNLVKDMKRYDLITVRESLSYEGLLAAGIKDNVVLCSDPAFTLDKIDLPLPDNFIESNTVGINVSPLIMSCEKKDGITKQNYIELIDYIVKNTDMNVALIPHVVWENNDDRIPLRELYEKFKNTNRICLINDCNCMELKGYISKCRFFVGARTHATIAAYSTCVPTLVVGYSIKAKGIAKDIFGTYDNYVLPVQSLSQKNDLTNAFLWMYNYEDEIKTHLKNCMPDYIGRAMIAQEKIEELLNERSY